MRPNCAELPSVYSWDFDDNMFNTLGTMSTKCT